MSILLSIAIFLVVLFVLILVHEWGHYIAAKKTGMRVDEFGIGFPPTIWSKRIGETVYALNALPIGGYVKIYGEDALLEGEEAVTDNDRARAFGARPKWAQALVLIAGVTMNVLLAYVILVGIILHNGVLPVAEDVASPDAALIVSGIMPGAPADGVLPVSATILAVTAQDGATLTTMTPSRVSDFIANYSNQPLVMTVQSNGATEDINITPQPGVIQSSPERAAIGIAMSLVEPVSFFGALGAGLEQTWSLLTQIVMGILGLFSGLVLGTADLEQIAGPVGIVSYVGAAAEMGLVSLLYFTAVISLNLAVINLLPIPALDGGRLIFVAIEAIIRRPIPPAIAGRANLLGFLFLMLIMLVVTVSDIWKLF